MKQSRESSVLGKKNGDIQLFEEDITEKMKNMGKLYQSGRDTILLAMKDANKVKNIFLYKLLHALVNVCGENMDLDQGAC